MRSNTNATTAIVYNKNAVPKSTKQHAAFSIKKKFVPTSWFAHTSDISYTLSNLITAHPTCLLYIACILLLCTVVNGKTPSQEKWMEAHTRFSCKTPNFFYRVNGLLFWCMEYNGGRANNAEHTADNTQCMQSLFEHNVCQGCTAVTIPPIYTYI